MSGQVLALLVVKGGRVASRAPANVEFDPPTGLVTFQNPSKLTAVPVVSYVSPNATYATETVFIKEYDNTTVTVWQGAQDASGRNHPPVDFTLVVGAV
jgi:hypothetical protein